MRTMKTACLSLVVIAVCFTAAYAQTPSGVSGSVQIFGWTRDGRNATEESIDKKLAGFKAHGFSGICYGESDPERVARVARIAHSNGLEYHAWCGAMLKDGAAPEQYAINREGKSARDVQPYVSYYKFLCPAKEETFQHLNALYGTLADIPEVDYVHLDYIRFPDVILARGLWEKYGLVMNEEYPVADYCYCNQCTSEFKAKYGIDIKSIKDPSTCEEWKQFRYDQITKLVNRLAAVIHAKGKKISAAVFPGPDLSKKLVRQEWNKWDIDAIFPMNYNDFYLEGPAWLAKICKEEVNAANGKPVYSGLFICGDWKNKANIKDPEGHGLLPSEIEEAVTGSIQGGAKGLCLFTPDRMSKEHWEAFDRAVKKIKEENK